MNAFLINNKSITAMDDKRIISGATEQEIWSQLEADLFTGEVLNYAAILNLNGHETSFYMDIDLGGGFEGGSEFMQFKTPLYTASPFRFAIHDKNFIDIVGKFFGMMDIEIGHWNLDKHLIIKTNNEEKLQTIFQDAIIREGFTQLSSFDCGIHMHHPDGSNLKQPFLELHINHVINDNAEFRKVFTAYYSLLSALEGV